jgi:hypothetical protein
MPHLRLEVPQEWLTEEHKQATGFDAKKLLDHLVETIANIKMESVKEPGQMVPLINKINLKHAIVPLYYAHVAGDHAKRFLHATLAAGNDTAGRTAAVRMGASFKLGDEIDQFIVDLPDVASVTVWVQDIDRDRGYTTTADRKKRREGSAS